MTNYGDELAWLYSLRAQGMRYELERMQQVLSQRGSPQKDLRVIHVAGTNGKGSVCALLEAALRDAGYKTGLYTSPHLHRFAERIRIRGVPVIDAQLQTKICEYHRDYAAQPLTFFEATTLFAWEIFRDEACDVVIAEVGLGGRLDATNVIDPEVSVVTEIGCDHQDFLGNTLEQIAAEKAAIIKPGRPSVIGCVQPAARQILQERAQYVDSPAKVIGRDFGWENEKVGRCLWTQRTSLLNAKLGLLGDHQWNNAATALATLDVLREQGWNISESAICSGFAGVQWPGRLEWISEQPKILLDAAHNESGCESLRRYLERHALAAPRVLLFAAMRDKNADAMLRTLGPFFDHRVYTTTQLERSQDPALFAQTLPGECVTASDEALQIARAAAGQQGTIVVAGSIFLVAAIRAQLLNVQSDPLIAM